MKHLSCVFLVVLIISCSSDNENEPEYIDNSLLWGAWYRKKTSIDSTVYIFKNDWCTREDWETWPTLSKESSYPWTYKLTKDKIILNDNVNGGWEYTLIGNKLSILENRTTWIEYTKVE
ncbi:hypothetical protein [Dysgonomonas sp. Marseille-Q5470]|uniref:hypothetical protein n=1 Tax=Dysgonomonas sp. Marseille-Q5470 TaxID=3039494 RepID=UPI0024BC0237|nr:hypothetical protein [Dysgonomonas sp. Marseille-Q5470]